MSLIQTFNKIASGMSEFSSFPPVRKRIREELANIFLDSPKDVQESYISTLFKWGTDKMHSTLSSDRVAALASFAFILDIIDDQEYFQNLVTQLERILPVENITVMEGITFVLERIARRSKTPILPTLIQRLTSRLILTSNLSSVYIFRNVIFTNNELYEKFGGLINQVVVGALRHENEIVRNYGIELFIEKTKREPFPDECGILMIDECLQGLENSTPLHICDGYVNMITKIMNERHFCLNSRIQNFIHCIDAILSVDNASIIAKRLFEAPALNSFITQILPKLLNFLCNCSNFSENVSKILSKFIEINENSRKKIFELSQSIQNDDLFFIVAHNLAKYYPDSGDYIFERIFDGKMTKKSIKVSAILNEFQPRFSDKIYQKYSDVINNKFDENIELTMQILISIDFNKGLNWGKITEHLINIFKESDKKLKILIIEAFYRSLLNIEENYNIFLKFLMIASSDDSKKIREASLTLIPDDLIVHFKDEIAFTILDSFYDDENKCVSLAALKVIRKVKESFPDVANPFFQTRISEFISQYQFLSSYSQKMEIMRLLPILINLTRDDFDDLIPSYVDFFIDILNQDLVPPSSIYEATLKRNARNNCRIIKKNVLHCINELSSKISLFVDKLSDLIKSITRLLFKSTHKSVHMEVGNTLILLFRNYDFQHNPNFDIIKLHKDILDFLAICHESEVIDIFLRLLGIIGPLDPYIFHVKEELQSSGEFDWSPICDVSKRKTFYIHFVMRYVLDQLIQNSHIYESSVLIIAIVYIFQSDPSNSLPFLPQIVEVFSSILEKKILNPPDAIFHFLRSIIMLVDVSILPFADTIMKMVDPFIEQANLPAIKTLSSLIFALKGNYNFKDVFQKIIKMLRTMKLNYECDTYMMLIVTLMTIFCDSNPHTFFELASDRIKKGYIHSLVFLIWVIYSGEYPFLDIPALKLALSLGNKQQQLTKLLKQLIYIIYQKNPELCNDIGITVEEVELDDFEPKADVVPNKTRPASQKRDIETVFSHVPASEYSPIWLLQLTQDLVLCSPSAAIRACRPLLNGASKFHIQLFPLALVSVWEDIEDNDRKNLSSFFNQVVNSPTVHIQVISIIVDAAEALDRAGFQMFNDPIEAGLTAEKSRSWFKAVRFFTKISDKGEEPLKHLLKVEAQMKRVISANGLLQVISDEQTDAGLFESLNMWDKARDIYDEHMENEISIPGRMKCSMMMEDYDEIIKTAPLFDSFTKETKIKSAIYFLVASLKKGIDYSKYEEFMAPNETHACICLAAAAISKHNLEQAEEFVNKGIIAVNSQLTPFNNYETALPAINTMTILEELKNVIDVERGKDTASHVLDIWSNNSDEILKDFGLLRGSLHVRQLLKCTEEQKRRINVEFLDALRRLKEWRSFDILYGSEFKGKDDPVALLLRATVRYERGITNNTDELNEMVKRLQNSNNDDVYCSAVCAMASHSKITEYVMDLLSDVLKKRPNMVKAWKIWTYANLNLTQRPENAPEFFANNAMLGFWRLIELTGTSMHFLCQLCSLFFNYATSLDNFKESAEKFRNLSAESVILIIPQLVVQLEHPMEEVRSVVFDIIKTFSKENFQAVALSLNLQHQNKKSDFIDSLFMEHLQESGDIKLFAKSMTTLAITPVEEVTILIDKLLRVCSDKSIHGEEIEIVKQIYEIITNISQKSFLHNLFSSSQAINFLDKCRKVLNPKLKPTNADKLFLLKTAQTLQSFLNRNINSVKSIDIDEVGLPIKMEKLSVTMPGFYETGLQNVTVEHVNHILKVIPSAKRPRKMRITGSDGNIYKYLLKGRDDLRLDQHIMQFFSLVNSILSTNKQKKRTHLKIMQYHVIPLTTLTGLISWAAGGETLGSLITWRRRIAGRSDDVEKSVFAEYAIKEKHKTQFLTKLQRVELFRDLCDASPDTEIAEALWLKSSGSQQWMMQTTNFSKSTALMSMVGYFIRLGDRHPLNILYMKRNGNVVHIDLSDCFGKAAMRKYMKERVPFRLTRMIVRAMGAGGTYGIFRQTAEDVLYAMRRNQQTLLAFLDIFVQEPSIDAMWYEENCEGKTCLRDAIKIVADKLTGRDFANVPLSKQVDILIEQATSESNLSQMFLGWAPYW